jgi:flagellar biosynthetic protein FlhB
MAGNQDQERTERATPKKRAKARRQGQVARSAEIPATLVLLSALFYFLWAGQGLQAALIGQMRYFFENLATLRLEEAAAAHRLAAHILTILFDLLFPLLLTLLVAAVGANLLQIGYAFNTESLALKLSKLNPLAGMGRVLSLRSLVELVKSLTKILFVGAIATLLVRRELDTIPALMRLPVGALLGYTAGGALRICFAVGLALACLAAVDYAYQRWQYERDLKMTKQEVKDEQRQAEGDPKIKARIRSIQREMAMRRMMQMVPKADVVITNPTHLAVALKFDAATMIAPQVVAKGAGHVAARIRELARAHGVTLVEQKPLAQALYKGVALQGSIPAELYRAVAEILAYVYRLKGIRPA